MIKFPGLIDPHVHPRGLPSDEYKEDFYTATSAALAGGFTTILDMPNNPFTPTLTYQRMVDKQNIARKKVVCDIGFFFGTNGKNLDEFEKVEKISIGLKVFLSYSTANLVIDHELLKKVCQKWTTELPILLHAEEDTIEEALEIIQQTGHKAHICHVSSMNELKQIISAKKRGVPVTCGVTPHHLFLNESVIQKLGSYASMKPLLKSQNNVDFLWDHLKDIDVIESDHAPHTREEKISSKPPYGVPGLETTLPLLLTAMNEKKITKEDIIDKCYVRPKAIFNIPEQPDTYSEIEEAEEWEIKNEDLFTKTKWSPFNGWKVTGRVKRVVIRGKEVYSYGKILGEPGIGEIITGSSNP
jgi:dihydroorotase-like cyclic amidohydrolase